MAQRRMLSKKVTNSSRFVMMPPSCQSLYLHLVMNADDDGYCEYYSVMGMCRANADDLKVLGAKGFVRIFDDMVLIVTDWKDMNHVTGQKYTASQYLESYPIDKYTFSSLNVDKSSTQVRLGQVRLGQDSTREDAHPLIEKSFSSWRDISEDLLTRISEEYEVPLEFVKDCHETAGNWLKAKGKVMKDYNAFFRNWVKREKAEYLLKARRGGINGKPKFATMG